MTNISLPLIIIRPLILHKTFTIPLLQYAKFGILLLRTEENITNKNFETSSSNVFADLGLPNPEERLVKAKLALHINLLINIEARLA